VIDWTNPIAVAGIIALCTLLVGALLATGAQKRGLLGRNWQPEGSRVPPVGGLALLLVLVCGDFFGLGSGPLPWAALGAAWVLGTRDDFRPLAALPKLAGQLGVALLFALHRESLQGGDWLALGKDLALAMVAQNLANTWDHSDGLCAGWALLLPGTPLLLRGALAGFLPLNLIRQARSGSGEDASPRPRAYLGDAGSHLVGILVALQPAAWLALALPAMDLSRVVWLRWRAGQAFWLADRRHLGHRLEARGWHPIVGLVPLWPLWLGWHGPQALVGILLSFGILVQFTARTGCTGATGRG
jgi:UDP-N-acetylmuramyl pentapeptide phosphotransferase/UDP-N-acetylglucosamine-1-phosphate transferase